jgi:hypothetical protein
VLGRDVLVLERLGLAECLLQHSVELRRDVRLRPLCAGKRRQCLLDLGSDTSGVHPQLAERGRDDSALLLEQRLQQVLGRDFRMVRLLRPRLGGSQGFLCLYRELIETHDSPNSLCHKR